MSYQKCPTCNGTGVVVIPWVGDSVCAVCSGTKIIDEQTGQPPVSKSEIKRLDCQGLPAKLGIGKLEQNK